MMMAAVEYAAMGPMKPAEYFTVSSQPKANAWKHYALAIPYYTHFTSPIRRYADVMVHRLLDASLNGGLERQPPARLLEQQCTVCNDRKSAAKSAQEMSDQVYLCEYL